MAVVTWDGSSSTDFATAANWDTGSVPTASDDVIIPDTSSINKCVLDQARNINSFVLAADGEFDGGNTLFIKGKNAAGEAVKAQGKLGDVTDFTIETASAATVILTKQSGSGSFRDLTINHASADITLAAAMSLGRNLTITAGELNTNSGSNYAVTVAGRTDIGPASGAADQATLTCNASTVSLGSGRTSSFALVVNQGGTFTGGTGTHTIGSIDVKSNSNAKCTLTSGVTTIDGEHAGDNKALEIGTNATFAHGSGTVTHTLNANTQYNRTGGVVALNNFIQNNNSNLQVSPSLTCAGDFTLTAGEFDTSGSNYAVTVTGDAAINGGQFVGNASAISFGSLTIASGGTYSATSGTTTITSETSGGYAIDHDGTFTHNNGTVLITTPATTLLDLLATGNLYNLTINHASCVARMVAHTTIDNDVTVTAGTLNTAYDVNVTVTGDVSVSGTFGLADQSGAHSFGSLKIASGGTHIATSGTTTLTNKNSSNYMLEDLGTFTHNNGTVHFKADTSSGTWYAVKGHSTEDTTEFYNVTTERVGSSIGNYRVCVGGSNQFFTVRNNLTVGANCKIFSSNGSSILRHSGLATIDGELDLDSFTDIEMGAVTINSGGTLEFDNGSITIKAESLRNVGGTINA